MRNLKLLLLLSAATFLLAQTRLTTDQRSPKIPQVVEWGVCQGSGSGTATRPDGTTYTYTWDCAGLELMRFRYQDGTTKVYTLIPATEQQAADVKFVRVPLN